MTLTLQYPATLTDLTEILTAPDIDASASVVSDGGSNIVRLVLRNGGLELAFDNHVEFIAGGNTCLFKPYLTNESREDLVRRGILPANDLDAMEQGSGLVLKVVLAHRPLIVEKILSLWTV